jgi:hypothetical protein
VRAGGLGGWAGLKHCSKPGWQADAGLCQSALASMRTTHRESPGTELLQKQVIMKEATMFCLSASPARAFLGQLTCW